MRQVSYSVGGTIMRAHDALVVTAGDDSDLTDALGRAVIDTIALDVRVTLGGATVHLAMLLDPDHWQDEWAAGGVDDPEAFLAALIVDD